RASAPPEARGTRHTPAPTGSRPHPQRSISTQTVTPPLLPQCFPADAEDLRRFALIVFHLPKHDLDVAALEFRERGPSRCVRFEELRRILEQLERQVGGGERVSIGVERQDGALHHVS